MITPDAIAVVAHRDHHITVTFADERRVDFDMKPYLSYPFFQPLNDLSRFLAARIEHGTVIWPGDIDMSPDTLYVSTETS